MSRLAPLELSRLAPPELSRPRRSAVNSAACAAGDVAATALRGKQRGSRRSGIGSEWNEVLELGYFLSQRGYLQPCAAWRYFEP
jgi:hypothetical protein